MKAVVAAINQEKALVGAFSMIVKPVVEPMNRFAALVIMLAVARWRSLLLGQVLLSASPGDITPASLPDNKLIKNLI